MTDRRVFLKTLAAAGAASLVPGAGLFGQGTAVKLSVRGGAIDVHHHFVAPGMPAGLRPPTRGSTSVQFGTFFT